MTAFASVRLPAGFPAHECLSMRLTSRTFVPGVAKDIPVEMHHAALPSRLGQIVRGAFDQPRQASEMINCTPLRPRPGSAEMLTSRIVLLGASQMPKISRNPSELTALPPAEDIAHLTGPTALHHDAVRKKYGRRRCDGSASLDLGVDLLVEVGHRAGSPACPRALPYSSTRRTEMPARYISISSTELCRR